jgi:hypothetical protein
MSGSSRKRALSADMGVSFRDGRCGLMLAVVYHERPACRPWGRVAKAVWSCGSCARWSCHPVIPANAIALLLLDFDLLYSAQ